MFINSNILNFEERILNYPSGAINCQLL